MHSTEGANNLNMSKLSNETALLYMKKLIVGDTGLLINSDKNTLVLSISGDEPANLKGISPTCLVCRAAQNTSAPAHKTTWLLQKLNRGTRLVA